MTEKDKIKKYLEYKGISKNKFYTETGLSMGFLDSGKSLGVDKAKIIIDKFPDLSIEWLVADRGDMLRADGGAPSGKGGDAPIYINQKDGAVLTGETRPRIPHSAAAGELAGISDGVMPHNCEQVPVIPMFKKYDFTIIVYGDSMLPHFHSGDEIACLTVRERSFIQWGRVHVLDTYQGVVVKRIFEREDGILCRSDNAEYPEFTVSGDDIYSIAVVIGLIRRC